MNSNNKYKVLCIGINQLPGKNQQNLNKLQELQCAEKNATTVAEYFESLGEQAAVTLLTGTAAQRAKIIDWMEECNSAREKDIIVILFFSGNCSAAIPGGREYPERSLWIYENNQHGYKTQPRLCPLPMQEILHLLDNPLQPLIVLIDSYLFLLHSSSISRMSPKEIFSSFEKTEIVQSLKPYTIISSTPLTIGSFEEPALEFSVFTYYLLLILSGKYNFWGKKTTSILTILQLLDKKVRDHRFTTRTGRKFTLHKVQPNKAIGISTHYSLENLKLPVLRPSANSSSLRLKKKILFAILIILIPVLLVYHFFDRTIRLRFVPGKPASLYMPLLTKKSVPLEQVTSERLMNNFSQGVTLYLFANNWIRLLAKKLDAQGRIILLGNLAGYRLTGKHNSGFNEKQLAAFALQDRDALFYWHWQDILAILRCLEREYKGYNANQRRRILDLFAAARQTFHVNRNLLTHYFKTEIDQQVRNDFLKLFGDENFLQTDIGSLNPFDCLYLFSNRKQIPMLPATLGLLHSKVQIMLKNVANSLPDDNSIIAVTDSQELSVIYNKLRLLASFGSPYLREKAKVIFHKAYSSLGVFQLFLDCRDLQDKIWLLQIFLKNAQGHDKVPNQDFLVWEQFFSREINKLTAEERGAISATIMDINLDLVPTRHWHYLFSWLRYVNPGQVTLANWSRWLRKYHLEPKYVREFFYSIIEKNYNGVFAFLKNFPNHFRDVYNEFVFDHLYQQDKEKTIRLARSVFEKGTLNERLSAGIFLYKLGFDTYSPFLVKFLMDARLNEKYQQVLKEYNGSINDAVIKLIKNNREFGARFRYVLDHPNFFLFYRFFDTCMKSWPDQALQRVMEYEIPTEYEKGIFFLRRCNQLPDIYKVKLLLKMNWAVLEKNVKYRAEIALAEHFPRRFLDVVNEQGYRWSRNTGQNIIDAYRKLPFYELLEKLKFHLNNRDYWRVEFICQALVHKKDKRKTKQFRQLLTEFDLPIERILLRKLRYNLNKEEDSWDNN